MIASTASFDTTPDVLRTRFLAVLPRIELHAQIYFRHLKCPDRRADAIAETVALAWKWFVRLAEQGKDAAQFVSALATYAARSVRAGRRLCGQLRAEDVLSELAQRRHGFQVESLPSSTATSHEELHSAVHGQRHLDAYEERLRDNTITPPPDAAAFRIDWPSFLGTLTDRDRQMAEYLSLGHRPTRAADKFGLTPGRVTQLRQQWCREWRRSQGEDVHTVDKQEQTSV